ncbi:hypothetical protein PV341_35525 [Streptomyces sp. PA03-1a]|nr:hypothetical protein [Streptomyces sp. PA03-1a]MDX2819131.1 hypothetical protein [Streptomyces sp. PA03-5A]
MPIVVGVLVVAAMIYDTARLITTGESRCPPLSRVRGHRAALEAAQRWAPACGRTAGSTRPRISTG